MEDSLLKNNQNDIIIGANPNVRICPDLLLATNKLFLIFPYKRVNYLIYNYINMQFIDLFVINEKESGNHFTGMYKIGRAHV